MLASYETRDIGGHMLLTTPRTITGKRLMYTGITAFQSHIDNNEETLGSPPEEEKPKSLGKRRVGTYHTHSTNDR